MKESKLLAMTLAAVLLIALGLSAVGTFGYAAGVLEKERPDVTLPCLVPEKAKDRVADALGDCLDSGGVLFGRVEPPKLV